MKKQVFWVIALLCILALWCFQNAITVNIPWWDDFHGIILPVYDLFTDKSLMEKFSNFFSLNNEHRVVNDRLFTLLIYLVTGRFELKALALLGFVNLIAIFLLLVKVLRMQKVPWMAILPVLFLIFHAQYYESLQSLMVPFQNFSVILYMLLSLYFLTFREKTGLAFFFALAALFSHGNGILVFILGALILLIHEKYKTAGWWTVLSIATIFLYFLGYTKPSWTSTDVVSPWKDPLAAIRYAFEFLGAYSLNLTNISTAVSQSDLEKIIPQLTGFLAVSGLLFLVLKKYPLKNLRAAVTALQKSRSDQFFLAMIAFFVATGIMMGLTRTGFPVLSRYTINSSFFLAGIWCFYVTHYSPKPARLVSILSFVGLLLTYYNASERAFFNRQNAITDGINYQLNGTWANQYSDSAHVARVNPLLTEPLKSGKYVFPAEPLAGFREWDALKNKEKTDYSIVDGHLMISGTNPDPEKDLFFSLESESHQFIFPARRIRNNPKAMLLQKSYYADQYRTIFPVHVIPADNYRIFRIERTGPDQFLKYDLGRTLTREKMVL